jgi:hypothetical protein
MYRFNLHTCIRLRLLRKSVMSLEFLPRLDSRGSSRGMVKPKGSRISLSYGAVSFVFHPRMGTKGSPRGMG